MTTESHQPTPDVFLSYASADREKALHLADLLEAQGISVWIDRKSIAGGTSWSAEIVRGIQGCAVLFVLVSEAAMASPNVQQEIQLGWENRRPFLPLLLEQTGLPEAIQYALAGRQWIEVRDRSEEVWLAEALRALRRLGLVVAPPAPVVSHLRSGPEPTPSPPPHQPPNHNLPAQVTGFVGRRLEVAEVTRLLADHRLLTLTGTGGCGKTRLALEIGAQLLARFPDGVWLAELASVRDPGLVPQTVAESVGSGEQPGQAILTTLLAFLQPRQALLLLDNCEHLVAAAADLANRVLRVCARVKILATSREALGMVGEVAWRVPSLSLPDPDQAPSVDAITRSEAVRLFVDRAIAVDPSFAVTPQNGGAVVQICRRLDGIPLALELAAARVKVLSVERIAARLDDQFRLLTGGNRTALPRQQTLRALIDWSYNLLADPERQLLQRLSVFAGGWTLEAAEGACGGDVGDQNTQLPIPTEEILDLLAPLVGKSLVLVEKHARGERYRLLETIGQYARDRLLESGHAQVWRDRHRAWFVGLAQRAGADLEGPRRLAWHEELDADHDNFRAALGWCLAGDPAAGLRTATILADMWLVRGYYGEARQWFEAFLARAPERTTARARALTHLGEIAGIEGNYTGARSYHEEAVAIYRELGDKRAIARGMLHVAWQAGMLGNWSEMHALQQESLAICHALGDQVGIARSRTLEGAFASQNGEWLEARSSWEASLALYREAGHELPVANELNNLGLVAWLAGDSDTARGYQTDSLKIRWQFRDRRGVAAVLECFAGIAATAGQPRRALRLAGATEAIRSPVGIVASAAWHGFFAEALGRARQSLGGEAADIAWAEGRAMTLEQAIADALGEDQP